MYRHRFTLWYMSINYCMHFIRNDDESDSGDVMFFEEMLIANVKARPALWNSKLSIQSKSKT